MIITLYKEKLENVAIANALHCNLKVTQRCASRSELFWPNLYCACTQTAILELSSDILTLPLDSVTPIA